MNHLLHPEYFDLIPVTGRISATRLNRQAAAWHPGPGSDGNVTVSIRAFNEAEALQRLLQDVHAQEFDGEVEVVVVDNESTDTTREVAKELGATVVTLARDDFTYPRSMNLAMEAASFNSVFLTVGHAELSNNQLLRAGNHDFADVGGRVGGVFGHALPAANASRTERLLAEGSIFLMKKKEILKGGLGVLAGTGAMIDREIWDELGRFDESYQTGGEDGALAKQMLKAGYRIIDDPLLSVHHTHGLGPINTVKQWHHWLLTAKPQALDLEQLHARRPDLNLSR